MNGAAANVSLLVTVGFAMVSVGLWTNTLAWRTRHRRCASCGRRIRRDRICPCARP